MPATNDPRVRDLVVRDHAMKFVAHLAAESPDGTVTRDALQKFEFQGEAIKLLDAHGRGIRNPISLMATLSILTSHNTRYDDSPGIDGFLRYAIRGAALGEGDNRKLQVAFRERFPLIWFVGIRSAVFVPIMPVFLIAEDALTKQYVMAIGHDQRLMAAELFRSSSDATAPAVQTREYVSRMTRQRLHQPAFRARVMHAYGAKCAVCSLKHGNLLDAAHILPDGHPRGTPSTTNGLALCKIHHAAYDQDILGISPDRVVFINERVLFETDGPMLKHGLQEFHHQQLRNVPTRSADVPNRDGLAERFETFRKTG